MIDRNRFTEDELELMDIAMDNFPDAFELAINTNDGELFEKVMKKSHDILIDRTLSGLVEKGYIEITGVDSKGDMVFSLTENGRNYVDNMKKSYNQRPVEDV